MTKEERQVKKAELVAVCSPRDISAMPFGGRGREQRERSGENVVRQLSVTLEG